MTKKLNQRFKIHILFFSFFISVSLLGCQLPAPRKHKKYDALKELLPSNDNTIAEIHDLKGGDNNEITLCKTTSYKRYLLRSQKSMQKEEMFSGMVDIHQKASANLVSPQLYNFSRNRQEVLMEYIASEPWHWHPYYSNPRAHSEAIKALKKFHDSVSEPGVFTSKRPHDFWPFAWLLNNKLNNGYDSGMPIQLKQAFARTALLRQKISPWNNPHPKVCHGDFHFGNVLLESKNGTLSVKIIDLDNVDFGIPLYDLARFTYYLPFPQRLILLRIYLGRKPTFDEAKDLAIIVEVERLVDAVIALEHLEKAEELPSQKKCNLSSQGKYQKVLSVLNNFLQKTADYVNNPKKEEFPKPLKNSNNGSKTRHSM